MLRKYGKQSIERHIQTKKHKDKFDERAKNRPLDAFVTTQPKIEKKIEFQTRLSEAIMSYHTVHNNLPFAHMDCLSEDLPEVAPDSAILKDFKCKRNKATAIVKHVLAPELRKKWIHRLGKSK